MDFANLKFGVRIQRIFFPDWDKLVTTQEARLGAWLQSTVTERSIEILKGGYIIGSKVSTLTTTETGKHD